MYLATGLLKQTKDTHIQQISEIKRTGLKRKSVSILAGLSISMLAFTSVDALNIGEARSQSYLGQPLNIFVPVDNQGQVINFNQLLVSKPSDNQLSTLNVSSASDGLVAPIILRYLATASNPSST